MMTPDIRSNLTGAVLAGGQSSRMGGGDKGLINVAGRPLAAWVIDAVRSQVGPLLVNANRNQDSYGIFGYPVVSDRLEGFAGPLAGIASCMEAAATDYLLCVPCDSPFLPGDLAERLYLKLQDDAADICMAASGEQAQPVFALFRCRLRDSLLAYLAHGGRKPDRWYARHRTATVDFSDKPGAFMNINAPEDLAAAGALLAKDS